ncbi:uncharacterized protein [Antedon mediterranea]|uniref:uncharacterized protein isoform X2 n=1 Tax=Antedon mediterranea TaxID=105859 RepID=UPI003AF6AD82
MQCGPKRQKIYVFQYGKIKSVYIPPEQKLGKKCGFAFLTFEQKKVFDKICSQYGNNERGVAVTGGGSGVATGNMTAGNMAGGDMAGGDTQRSIMILLATRLLQNACE